MSTKTQHRIAHIMSWTALGGTEISQLRIAQALEGKHFNSIFFCLPGEHPTRKLFAEAGFKTATFEAVEPSYRHPRKFLTTSLKLREELKRLEIDLVHCSDMNAAHYTAIAGRLARLPVISHVRNPYPNISRRDQSFLYAVQKFVFVSRDSWKQFGYKVTPKRGTLIYDGFSINGSNMGKEEQSVREEFKIPAKTAIVGMVARVNPQKDYSTLIKAAARIVSVIPDVRFLIVGDHSDGESNRAHYEKVKQMLAASKVTPYFIFTGQRNDSQRLINAMDVAVLSSHWEGFGLVLLEASAHGKPVVATKVGGVPEIVLHEKTGLLSPPGDDEQMANYIVSLLRNKELAAKLGEEGRKFVETNFSEKRFTENMMNLYYEMVGVRTERGEAVVPDPKVRFKGKRA